MQPFHQKYFKYLKLFQYSTYLISVLFLVLSMTCSQVECGAALQIPYQQSFQYLFSHLTDDVLIHHGVELFVLSQAFFLIIPFLVAIFIGLKILPTPLSEIEKTEIMHSPYNAFSNLYFSKTLFGGVKSIGVTLCDMRNEKLNIVADLYLLHFKICRKENWLIFMFLFLFIVPIFVPLDNKVHYFQLLMNFIKINLSLFLFFELIMFGYSKLLVREKKNVA